MIIEVRNACLMDPQYQDAPGWAKPKGDLINPEGTTIIEIPDDVYFEWVFDTDWNLFRGNVPECLAKVDCYYEVATHNGDIIGYAIPIDGIVEAINFVQGA